MAEEIPEKKLEDFQKDKKMCGDIARPNIPRFNDDQLPTLSILTPTYNRRKFRGLAAFNIKMFDYPKDKLEWLIIDDGDEPFFENADDLQECRRYLHPVKITYKYNKSRHLTIGEKRNMLVKQAKYKTVAFLDDDDIYLPTYLRYSITMMKYHKVGMVGSPEMIFVFPYDNWKLSMIRCPAKRQNHEATMVFTKKFFNSMPGFAKNSQGEGAKMIDFNENNVAKTAVSEVMICVAHKNNTINKDREDFKKNQIKMEGDLLHMKVLADILQIKYP